MSKLKPLYKTIGSYYDIIYSRSDYPRVAAQIVEIVRAVDGRLDSILDIGCGTGRHLEELNCYSRTLAGVDISEALLMVARERLPSASWTHADMISFEMHRKFDVVMSLLGVIAYLRTNSALDAAIGRMRGHLAPGGVLIVEPWLTPENFRDGLLVVNTATHGSTEIRWMYRQRRTGRRVACDVHYLVGDNSGVRHLTERQRLRLFSHDEITTALRRHGLQPVFQTEGFHGYGLYVCQTSEPSF